jgi:1,2-diacylglycerol 3-beta-galactosyltransferase
MTQPKRILILYAQAGFGHRSAAQAIATALQESYGERVVVEVVNPMDSPRTPAPIRNAQNDYDQFVRQMPDLYKFTYDLSDTTISARVMERVMTVTLFESVRDIIKRFQPDAIVTTYQNYLYPLDAQFLISRKHIPLITVVTDLTLVHRLWFDAISDWTLVPTDAVRNQAIDLGLDAERVRVTGIAVHPRLATDVGDRDELCAEFGWRSDRVTVLAVGSKRVPHLLDTLNVLNHSGLPLQLIAIAGGDTETYDALRATDWHVPAYIYNYVDNLQVMIRAADCMVTKAGGLIVSESLAAGLPILLVDVIEGQETGNARYVVDGGAGEQAHTPIESLEIMCHWLANDRQQLVRHAERARALGRPCAAFDIAEIAFAEAERGERPAPDLIRLPKLTDLLTRFNVPWGDT